MSEDAEQTIVIGIAFVLMCTCMTTCYVNDKREYSERYRTCVQHHKPAECRP